MLMISHYKLGNSLIKLGILKIHYIPSKKLAFKLDWNHNTNSPWIGGSKHY